MTRRSWRLAGTIGGLALAVAGSAGAQLNCRVTVPPLSFGTYVPGSTAPLDVTGSGDFRCAGQQGAVLVTIAAGSSGSYGSRTMLAGPLVMQYNIFINAARTLVWGDGTGGSVINGVVKTSNGRQDFSLPAYGRIPPLQSVGAGLYQDDLLVTVIF